VRVRLGIDDLRQRHHDATAVTPAGRDRENLDTSRWSGLFRVGAFAAFGVIAFVPIQLAVLLIWPLPTTVAGWFARFGESAIGGLLDMDLLMVADYVFFALLFVALVVALRDASPSLAVLMVTLELLAVAVYLSSTRPFEMLAASGQYAAATTDAERGIALAAGQTLLLGWQGTAFSVSYVLAGAAQLLAGVAMLRGDTFGRITAYAGIVAGVAALVPPTVGTIGLVFSLVSLIPMWIWLLLTGRTLLRHAA
jgi:hypothetical protein